MTFPDLSRTAGATRSPRSRISSRYARNGRMFILVDHEDRGEQRATSSSPRRWRTPDAINFNGDPTGRGLICLALTGERVERARAAADVVAEFVASRDGVGRFTVSIEAREGVSTGHLRP